MTEVIGAFRVYANAPNKCKLMWYLKKSLVNDCQERWTVEGEGILVRECVCVCECVFVGGW